MAQSPAKTWRDGGDGYATFLKGGNRLGGTQDIDALVAFVGTYKAPRRAYTLGANAKDAGSGRIHRVGASTTCPSGTNTNP